MSPFRTLVSTSIVLWLFASTSPLLAQQTVTIALRRPPPNQLRLADLWRATINNMTGQPLRVYLHGTVHNDRDGLLADARSATFSVGPGRTTLRGSELEPVILDESHPRYRELVARTGTVPSGDYRVCVTVVSAESGDELGSDCYDQQIEHAAPPELVSPADGDAVVLPFPTFTWLQPGSARRARYRLQVVEVIGRQSSEDAVASNPPIVRLDNLTVTTAGYPAGGRKLEKGRRYAWYIEATDAADASIPLGRSEVWQFIYEPLRDEIDINDARRASPNDSLRLINAEKILLLDDC